MPRAVLNRQDAEQGRLPMICLACGSVATMRKSIRVRHEPLWVWLFILAGPVALLFYMLALQPLVCQQLRMSVPFCASHANHWKIRDRLIFGVFFALLGLLVAGFIGVGLLMELLGLGKNLNLALTIFVYGWLFLLVVWFVAAVWLFWTKIRIVQITEQSLTLTNVAEALVRATRRP